MQSDHLAGRDRRGLDQVALQSPANAGSLAGTEKFGVDAGVGFDIYAERKNGKTVAQVGLATLEVKSPSRSADHVRRPSDLAVASVRTDAAHQVSCPPAVDGMEN